MRKMLFAAAMLVFGLSSPAHAQFFLKSADLRDAPVAGIEPGIVGQAMPGATPEEARAALVWNMRAALNIAALQCDFERTLLTPSNYSAMLTNHKDELKRSYDTLTKYFVRTAGNVKNGQRELDRFGTRVYSGFSTISAQYIFCQTAGSIGRDALFTPRGELHVLAENRMRELRKSLIPWGEQQFPAGYGLRPLIVPAAFGDARCWKGSVWDSRRCGAPFQGASGKKR